MILMIEVKLSFPANHPPFYVITTTKVVETPILEVSSLASGSLPIFLISSNDNELKF